MQRQRSPSPQHMPAAGMEANPMAAQGAVQGPMAAPGMGNAAMLERMQASQGQGQGQGTANDPGAGLGWGQSQFSGQEQLLASVQGESLVASNVDEFVKTNVYKAMVRLVEKEGWDPEFAASWLGQAIVETGKKNLEKLDVVERGTGEGRGMFQYSYSRRGPYDRARQQAIRGGTDPNDINWQIDYALNGDNAGLNFDNFRKGLTDPNQNYQFNPRWGTATGYSPNRVPYGNKFNDANSLMKSYGDDKVGGYSRALSGEFTRPGEPHQKRRLNESRRILKLYREATRGNPLKQLGGVLV